MDNDTIYYKVLNKDMKSPTMGFQYELNKKYEVDSNLVELYYYGFHVCKNTYELIIYCNGYKLKDCRFFKCYLGNTIEENKYIIVSNSITLIEELDKELVIKEIEDHLNILINDSSWGAKVSIAKQGYGLDKLINDPDWHVRTTVAQQGYGLDKLINDPYWIVRCDVAKQGYGLDILINDYNSYVRAAVAYQGYRLDVLINDLNPDVRKTAKNAKYKMEEIK